MSEPVTCPLCEATVDTDDPDQVSAFLAVHNLRIDEAWLDTAPKAAGS